MTIMFKSEQKLFPYKPDVNVLVPQCDADVQLRNWEKMQNKSPKNEDGC